MTVTLVLEDSLINGGAFHQAINAIKQFNKLSKDNFDFNIIYSKIENKRVLDSYNSIYHKYTFIDKLFLFFSTNDLFLHIVNRFKLLSSLEKKIISNKGDVSYFLTQSITPIILQKTPFIYTLFDLCHLQNQEFPEVRNFGIFRSRQIVLNDIIPKAILTITDSKVTTDFVSNKYSINRFIDMPYGTADFNLENNLSVTSKYKENQFGEYIFYPAQFWPHKNHVRIIQALSYLKNKNLLKFKIVFVGSDKGNLDFIKSIVKKNNLNEDVIILGFVNNAELYSLYKNCAVVLMASYFGSTNIPPLEAFIMCKPLINSIVCKEQTKDAAIYFDPDDYKSLANAIIEINDQNIVKDLVKNGQKRLDELSIERSISEEKLKIFLKNYFKKVENFE
jgi:glycosyltransferase involved in cell wall biosynthesis